ncbi:MAG: hypothetical protein LQ351_004481 [Letrouitia transgressa]|nr:MAG: hypothetical protein LQ351_004481 [Letrouitia transgressa]
MSATYGDALPSSVYSLASLGLALNRNSYAVLLVFRALQSLGASAVLAIAYGVVADLCVPAERGSMQGPTMGVANLAVCVGPVIGGWIALGSGGYQWVFWALVIFGGLVFVTVGFALPETARNVVGNGSISAKWSKTWWSLLTSWMAKRHIREKGSQNSKDVEKGTCGNQLTTQAKIKSSLKVANPWASIRILFWRDTALVLWMAGSPYAVWYCVQATIPPVYQDVYKFNELQIGLSFLSGGFGTVLGGYANGKLMDFNYKTTAKKIGHTVDKKYGDDITQFPIEKARARGAWYIMAVYICALLGYGWAVHFSIHQSVPLILQFVLAAICTSFQQTFNALLVDIFPASPSTAAASGNISRCILSAIAVAVLDPLVRIMGRGWFFTLLSALSGGGGVVANWLINAKGMKWRSIRTRQTQHNAQG